MCPEHGERVSARFKRWTWVNGEVAEELRAMQLLSENAFAL